MAGAGDRDERDVVAHRRQRVEHARQPRGLLGGAVAGARRQQAGGARAERDEPVAGGRGGQAEHRRFEARGAEVDDAAPAGASGQASAGAPSATCTVVVGTRPVAFSMSRRGHNWPAARPRRRTSTPATSAAGGAMRPSPPAKRSTSASRPAAIVAAARPATRSAHVVAGQRFGAQRRFELLRREARQAGPPVAQRLRRGHQQRLQTRRREPQHQLGQIGDRRRSGTGPAACRGPARRRAARRRRRAGRPAATARAGRGRWSAACGSQASMRAATRRSPDRPGASVAVLSSEPPATSSGASQPSAATISVKKVGWRETSPAR